jgi:hypothetical protein
VEGSLHDVAGAMTSSPGTGEFLFRDKEPEATFSERAVIDLALDMAFQARSRSTLAVNCLPIGVSWGVSWGVSFSSERMAIATTCVLEDMAVALIKTFARRYDQSILMGDPACRWQTLRKNQADRQWSKLLTLLRRLP